MFDETPHIGIFITHEEVTGKRAQMADVVRVLSRLNIHGVLRMIALLNASFVGKQINRQETRNLQNVLVSQFFDNDLKRQLNKSPYHKDLAYAVFYRQQQLLMLRMALTSCASDEGMPWNEESAFQFGKACLMINDMAGHRHDELQTDDSPLDVASRMLAIGELPSDNQTAGLVGRAYEVWLQIPEDATLRRNKNYVPIAERFHEAYGVSLEHFVQGLFLMLVKMEAFSVRNPDAFDSLIFNAKTYLNEISFPAETFQKILDIVSCKLEALKDKSFTEPVQNQRFDFSLLRRYPLIQVEDGIYLCHDVGFYRKFFTDGIYWRIHDALPTNEQDAFRSFFGAVMAVYTEKIMGHVYASSPSAPQRSFTTSPAFTENKGEVCDIFMREEDAWIVIETKASLLTTRSKYLEDGVVLGKELQEKFVLSKQNKNKGVGQLANSIGLLVSGTPTNAPGIKLVECRRVYPVLISYDAAIVSPGIPEYLESEFRSHLETQLATLMGKAPRSPKIMPLTVLSMDDVEALTCLVSKPSMSTLLSTYHHKKAPAQTLASFLWDYPYYTIDAKLGRFYDAFLALSDSIASYY